MNKYHNTPTPLNFTIFFIACLLSILLFMSKLTKDGLERELTKYRQQRLQQEQPIQEEVVVEEPEEPQEKELPAKESTPVIEKDEYSPSWNVEGSMRKAESRQELIKHLSGFNHNFDVDYLKQLSTDDLQRLHDQDHESRRINKPSLFRKWRLFR